MAKLVNDVKTSGMTDALWGSLRSVVDNGASPNYSGQVRKHKFALCDAEALQLRVARLKGIPVELSPYMARALDTLTQESGRWAAAA